MGLNVWLTSPVSTSATHPIKQCLSLSYLPEPPHIAFNVTREALVCRPVLVLIVGPADIDTKVRRRLPDEGAVAKQPETFVVLTVDCWCHAVRRIVLQ